MTSTQQPEQQADRPPIAPDRNRPSRKTQPPKRDRRKQTGNRGEDIAAAYLEQKGLRLLARNWRKASGELDIIAAHGSTLVFVEVRTRSSHSFGSGEESVDQRKQRQVRRMAALYLSECGAVQRRYRFDVIIVDLTGPGRALREIRHYPNAF